MFTHEPAPFRTRIRTLWHPNATQPLFEIPNFASAVRQTASWAVASVATCHTRHAAMRFSVYEVTVAVLALLLAGAAAPSEATRLLPQGEASSHSHRICSIIVDEEPMRFQSNASHVAPRRVGGVSVDRPGGHGRLHVGRHLPAAARPVAGLRHAYAACDANGELLQLYYACAPGERRITSVLHLCRLSCVRLASAAAIASAAIRLVHSRVRRSRRCDLHQAHDCVHAHLLSDRPHGQICQSDNARPDVSQACVTRCSACTAQTWFDRIITSAETANT